MNISSHDPAEESISRLLCIIGQPVRVQILFIIGAREACVCHLEAALGLRQASISQHLMVLRKAGLVTAQREGRNIFYHLTHPETLDILRQAALLTECGDKALQALAIRPLPNCPCPQCNPGSNPDITTCQNSKKARSS